MPWFLIEPSGYRYPISDNEEDGLSIGRTPDNDVLLADAGVSRHHAFIRVRGQEAWLYDRGSANGTWVNGQRLTGPYQLHPEDKIRLGGSDLRLHYEAPETLPRKMNVPHAVIFENRTFFGYVLIGALLGLLGVVAVGFALWPRLTHSAAPELTVSPYTRFTDAIRATVFVLTPVGNTPNGRAGSGVILTSRGRILTAYSVVINPATGRSYNRNNQVLVGLTPAPGEPTGKLTWYQAHVVRADRQRDMAVLQIFAREDGAPLPNSFRLPVMPMADSDTAQIQDALAIISFPAGGENTGPTLGRSLALGEGHLTAIIADETIQVQRGWFAIDVALGISNIGAPVLDARGRLIGLYPGPDAVQKSGEANAVRPINLARLLWVTGP